MVYARMHSLAQLVAHSVANRQLICGWRKCDWFLCGFRLERLTLDNVWDPRDPIRLSKSNSTSWRLANGEPNVWGCCHKRYDILERIGDRILTMDHGWNLLPVLIYRFDLHNGINSIAWDERLASRVQSQNMINVTGFNVSSRWSRPMHMRQPINLSQYWPWNGCTSTWLVTGLVGAKLKVSESKYANSIETKDFSLKCSFLLLYALAVHRKGALEHGQSKLWWPIVLSLARWAISFRQWPNDQTEKKHDQKTRCVHEVHCPSNSALSNVTAGNRQSTSRPWCRCMHVGNKEKTAAAWNEKERKKHKLKFDVFARALSQSVSGVCVWIRHEKNS